MNRSYRGKPRKTKRRSPRSMRKRGKEYTGCNGGVAAQTGCHMGNLIAGAILLVLILSVVEIST